MLWFIPTPPSLSLLISSDLLGLLLLVLHVFFGPPALCQWLSARIFHDAMFVLLTFFLAGCQGMWDIVACWPSARVGEVVTITCPTYFSYFRAHFGHEGMNTNSMNIHVICDVYISLNCSYEALKCEFTPPHHHPELLMYVLLNPCFYIVYTKVRLYHNFTAEIETHHTQKLHCTRNYIHMHLFVSFILKAIAVFVKDVVLYEFGEVDNCSLGSVGCKAVIVFFQYCVMASFFWLLVEGLYLHALLAVSFFSERKYFWAYIMIGWGESAVFFIITVSRLPRCWDIIETTDVFWWIIKTPILASILVNFLLFICIIRILRQKINCPDIGRNESNQYLRLAKSTLLLIPLFGINFIVFAFIPEQVKTELRLIFDLILGSFQGFVVAVLYCFLNAEVQGEIKRKWRRWHLQRYMGSDTKYQHPSNSSNNFSTQITMLTRCSPKTRRGSSSCHDDLSSI
uniref:Vasoactive intestinal peptide receptor 1b n=1 Tax=Poecilia reticulata TaxID=8081 RepID=A0A3P9Q8Z9_POERE